MSNQTPDVSSEILRALEDERAGFRRGARAMLRFLWSRYPEHRDIFERAAEFYDLEAIDE